MSQPSSMRDATLIPGLCIRRVVLPWNSDGGVVCAWPPEITLAYLRGGSAEVWAGGKLHQLKEGQGIFLNSDCPQTAWAQEPCEFFAVLIDPELVCGPRDGAIYQQYAAPLFADAQFSSYLLDPGQESEACILRLLEHLEALDAARPAGYELQGKAFACMLWAGLHTLYNARSPAAKRRGPAARELPRLREGLSYIHQHYQEKLTLDTIAQACCVSKSECCRLFQRTLRQTPFEYLLRYRVHRSVAPLLEGDLGITELAWITGFSSASYFSEIFRRYYGCSPTEYRCSRRE